MSCYLRCITNFLQARAFSFQLSTKRRPIRWYSYQLHQLYHHSKLLPLQLTYRHSAISNYSRAFSLSANESQATFTSFQPALHPATLHALTHKLKLVHPTDIQIQSYQAAITRRDVLARARTGTGKTLSFLIPAVENALVNIPPHKRSVRILVICPTRELASQIHSTSQVIATSHSNSNGGGKMHTQVMYGGVSKEKDVQKLREKLPFILVATPGRLLDHMENTTVGGEDFRHILGRISVLVLDEVSAFYYLYSIRESLSCFARCN